MTENGATEMSTADKAGYRRVGQSSAFGGISVHEKNTGANSGGVNAQGVIDSRILPDPEFLELWESIVIDPGDKNRLLSQAVLNFTTRPRVARADLPLHGVILLVGAPGTGKTSIAKGLAARTATSLSGLGQFIYIEVDPHALVSAALGRSQRAVTELLGSTIAEQAAVRPLIVLLDEVETLAADRSRLSLEANPVDVHRATDAVLAQLDHLATTYPRLLFIATSNFPDAIDKAFVSRADLVMNLDLPGPEACRQILTGTLQAMTKAFPAIANITKSPEFAQAVSLCQGLDGRRIRKLVATACTFSKETAIDPGKLTAADILRSVVHERKQAGLEGEKR